MVPTGYQQKEQRVDPRSFFDWVELALYKGTRTEEGTADGESEPHSLCLETFLLEMERASRRQGTATRARSSIGSMEIFTEGTAYSTTKRAVQHGDVLARSRQGRAGEFFF
jgi:hypothetical protein